MSVSAQTISNESSPEKLDGHAGVVDAVRRILLVDEQAHVLRVIRLNLERCGYLVDAVMSADLTFQHVRSHHYDALIMTSDLPDMTSEQLCERTQILLDGCDSGLTKPLILVGLDEGVEWTEQIENREPLRRPVSLKLILAHLGKHFDEAKCGATKGH